MPLPPGDFSRLLRELRNAGPVDRIRLLGRSLAALRGLSPWDRKVLLRMAGFEGAEALVERLAGEDRETARSLIRVLGELEKDPEALERTVRDLADPERRSAAVDELLATLDRTVAAPAADDEETAAEEEAAAAPEDEPSAPPPPLPEAPVPAEPIPPAPVPPAPPPGGERSPEAPPPPTAVPSADAPSPPAPARRRSPGGSTAPPEPPPPPPGPPPRAPGPRPRLGAVSVSLLEPAVPAENPSAVSALEALLDLRRRLDSGTRPSVAELRRLLDRELPFPWARRRAIQAWLSAGPVDDLEGALSLVDTLPAGADRAWCLATLAGARTWGAEAWRRIVDAAAGDAARRHLELRRRRRP